MSLDNQAVLLRTRRVAVQVLHNKMPARHSTQPPRLTALHNTIRDDLAACVLP